MTSSNESGTEPRVPIVCPECETTSRIPLADVADSLERHNAQLHDGEAIARVDPDVADRIADLVAEELGLLEDG
ncbi:hypothetical protein [Natrialbaceae archaeon AArc-T1-2]|uniref:hypothetical protein n=1 Tax=Natrialbaceae archaeon AArc-T1-2 TaxID=3053904 RepID=UPI00255A8254|nr:hypothetical protein [Natrialbaceae archaeon AArc-T1-2]WIV66516.1 hypothetical protein QQ977_12555 [Natrialbaceae archaeon AArc-T1-2]